MPWPELPDWEALDTVATLHTELNLARDRLNFLKRMPAVRAYRLSAQSIPNVTVTKVQFNAVDPFDTYGEHDPAVNNTRITITEPGWRLFVANIRFATNTVGIRGVYFTTNDVFDHYSALQGYIKSNGQFPICAAMARPCVVGDYIECNVFQSSGGALNIEADGNATNAMTALMLHG